MLPRFSHPGRVMAAATTVKLVISSEVRLVDVVHSASETMAGLAGFDEDESLNVGLAVREAVINAIVHGNKRDPSRRVDVVLKARPRSITAQVRDQGSGFDLEAMNDPTAEANSNRKAANSIHATACRSGPPIGSGHSRSISQPPMTAAA